MRLFEKDLKPVILVESAAFSGVRKIAEKVAKDIERVTDYLPCVITEAEINENQEQPMVIAGTVGKSEILDQLEQQGVIDFTDICGKREVYGAFLVANPIENVKEALIIAGSDKRGTIYGLFHISEYIGVSPLVDFCDVKPAKQETLSIEKDIEIVTKEPSVRFRGFFINDEWPAFGNWCNHNFGGFNAECYEHVFELLLRLKGNYLWPAMWSARFEDDGPGLLNAELADELGVVMGMSHHEPCLRQGEEYKYLRGKDSIYGDAWNFRTNKEGITRFWDDGLKRSGKFENVITVGMRGEADTAILGKGATLADNIELLRDVLKTQRDLIKKDVNENLEEVPRMIALYKEVEEFFYGNEQAKGLIGCEELEDVILMLCDDNFGNLRTLPTKEMRSHKGGYGMYYHFDYHGWPTSFEWVNSSYLPKVWEQMTMAYDFGIRDLWIVNVGDICTQEFPLSYFLDLAYDFEKWGTNAINTTTEYTKLWVERQFGATLTAEQKEQIVAILEGYTRIIHRRRPEAMTAETYHPVMERESQKTLNQIEEILEKCQNLYDTIDAQLLPGFFSTVYYPAVATMNLAKMQILTGINHYLAGIGAVKANDYAAEVEACFMRDRKLVNEYHTIDHEKWYGMGLSEHMGFVNWNEDECKQPVTMRVFAADKPRLVVTVDGTTQHVEGSFWINQHMEMKDFLDLDVNESSFTVYGIGDSTAEFKITDKPEWATLSQMSGYVDNENQKAVTVQVIVDRKKIEAQKDATLINPQIVCGTIAMDTPAGNCYIELLVCMPVPYENKNIFLDTKGYVAIEAGHTYQRIAGKLAQYQEIENYGKTVSAMKAYPTTAEFEKKEDAPGLDYCFTASQEGDYEVECYFQPSNPSATDNKLQYAMEVNHWTVRMCDLVDPSFKVGDDQWNWAGGVLNNIRKQTTVISCKKGINHLTIYPVTPGIVLEKLVIRPEGKKMEETFLGPAETYYTGRE